MAQTNEPLTSERLAELRDMASQPWTGAGLLSEALAEIDRLHVALAAAEARAAEVAQMREIVAIVAGCPRTPDDVAHLAISHAMSDRARALLAATEATETEGSEDDGTQNTAIQR